jgi:hypothetical protein
MIEVIDWRDWINARVDGSGYTACQTSITIEYGLKSYIGESVEETITGRKVQPGKDRS